MSISSFYTYKQTANTHTQARTFTTAHLKCVTLLAIGRTQTPRVINKKPQVWMLFPFMENICFEICHEPSQETEPG